MERKTDTYVYSMSLEVALLFYGLCEEFELGSLDERQALLAYLAKEGLMYSVSKTGRTPEQIKEDYKKNFNVLDLTRSNDVDSNPN